VTESSRATLLHYRAQNFRVPRARPPCALRAQVLVPRHAERRGQCAIRKWVKEAESFVCAPPLGDQSFAPPLDVELFAADGSDAGAFVDSAAAAPPTSRASAAVCLVGQARPARTRRFSCSFFCLCPPSGYAVAL
jgi:hypothetical protein